MNITQVRPVAAPGGNRPHYHFAGRQQRPLDHQAPQRREAMQAGAGNSLIEIRPAYVGLSELPAALLHLQVYQLARGGKHLVRSDPELRRDGLDPRGQARQTASGKHGGQKRRHRQSTAEPVERVRYSDQLIDFGLHCRRAFNQRPENAAVLVVGFSFHTQRYKEQGGLDVTHLPVQDRRHRPARFILRNAFAHFGSGGDTLYNRAHEIFRFAGHSRAVHSGEVCCHGNRPEPSYFPRARGQAAGRERQPGGFPVTREL
jgi:hypothetical protein